MYHKIYIHDKPLYLCNEVDETISRLLHRPDTIFIDELDNHTIKAMLKEMRLPEIATGIFYHEDIIALRQQFFKKFECIQAGGGLVMNEKKELLLIFRRGFWDLPKGKLDAGETLEQCAVREVKEETGLQNITLQDLITVTYHTYEQGTHAILKESHWYAMKANSHEPLTAQTEEDITQIQWMTSAAYTAIQSQAYPSIADVIDRYQHLKSKK